MSVRYGSRIVLVVGFLLVTGVSARAQIFEPHAGGGIEFPGGHDVFEVADFNGDGLDDLVGVRRFPGMADVFLATSAGTFAEVVPELLSDHRLLIPDMAGHGASEPREGILPMQVIFGGLEALLEEAALDRPVLAGNSMGAWLAMLYAHKYPDRLSRSTHPICRNYWYSHHT